MSTEQSQPSRRRSVLFIGGALVLVVLALYVTTQVVSVLFGIISPPTPPLPPGLSEVSHESTDYGVDSWTYTSSVDACDVVSFYEANDGTCSVAAGQCGREGTDQARSSAMAQCIGNVSFSIFHMQWTADVHRDGQNETRIQVNREVFWIGTGLTPTPYFASEQLSPSPNATNAP